MTMYWVKAIGVHPAILSVNRQTYLEGKPDHLLGEPLQLLRICSCSSFRQRNRHTISERSVGWLPRPHQAD